MMDASGVTLADLLAARIAAKTLQPLFSSSCGTPTRAVVCGRQAFSVGFLLFFPVLKKKKCSEKIVDIHVLCESFVICIRVPRLHAYSAVPNCPRVAGAMPEDYSRASLPITVVRIEQRTKSSGLEVRNNASIKVVRV